MQETDFDYMTQPKFTKFQKFIINDWIHWLTIVGISRWKKKQEKRAEILICGDNKKRN